MRREILSVAKLEGRVAVLPWREGTRAFKANPRLSVLRRRHPVGALRRTGLQLGEQNNRKAAEHPWLR